MPSEHDESPEIRETTEALKTDHAGVPGGFAVERVPEHIILARSFVFSGLAALHPSWKESDLVAAAKRIVDGLHD